uniref:Tail tape measure protein n=1 Tax=Siphoviridae sp. ctRNB7 TaxID=2825502 RepID=A0A8S5PV57_9CAUD|nr:MAG TPA: tail tape measure protein [Siphoviridae sp. ctRNB7]
MQPQDGALLFQVRADQSKIQKDVEAIKKHFEKLTEKVKEEGKKQADVWQTLLKGATAYFTLQGVQSFISQMIAVRSEFQQLEISFGTMLKSKEKANALMAQMTELAAKTPFGLQEVSEGAKRLLAFQVPAQEVTETLRRMGDVAAGLGIPMGQLIHVYGQVKAQGRLFANDLYQFMNAGIPIIAELSKVVGKSETEIKDMVSAGKIGFPEVQAVIKNMTNEGGLFFNLMAEQSKSLGGQISNLQDNFDQMLNEIGKASEGVVSGAISGVAYLVENYQTLGKIIAGLITTYGAYRAAVIVNNTLVALSTQLTNGWTVAQLAQYRGLLLLEKAQKLLNATMLANPYVFMATAVAALAAAMFVLTDRTSSAEKAQKRLNEEREIAMAKEQEHKQHIEELIDTATNQYLADTDRRKALTELAGAYPQIFAKYDIESIKLADILKLKKEIAEFDANKARGQRQTDYSKNKEYAKILYDIGTKQGSKGFDEIAKGSDLDRIITEKFGNHWRTFGNYSEIYAYFNEKQKNAKKELKSDALSDWTANLKNQSESDLQKQLEQRKRLIADLQKQEKEGKKWASHGVKFGEEWYAFNKEELQSQAQALQAQLDHLHEKTYEYKDLTKKYTQAVKDAEKALDTIKNGGKGKHTEEEFAKIIKEAEDNLKNAKNALKEHQTSLNKKAATKAKKETLPEFDTEKANRDHQRQIQDDLFRQEEARIKIMQDGTDKRLAIIQLEYDKQEEEIRRRSQDQLAAFIETQKAKAAAVGKWKKGQDFDTNTEAINAEKARLAENEKTLLADNAEYQRFQQEQVYKDLLEKYKTYEEEKNKIFEEFEKDRLELEKNNVNGQNDERIKELLKKKARKELEFKIKEGAIGDDIGVLFTDINKKTSKQIDEMVKKAEEAFDSFQKLFQGSDDPEILNLLKNIREGIDSAKEKADEARPYFERLGKNFKKAFGKNREDGDGGEGQNYERQKAVSSIAKDIDNAREAMGVLTDMFKALGDAMDNKNLKEFAKTLNEISNIIDKTMKGAEVGGKIGKGAGAIIGAAIGLTTAIAQNVAAHEKKQREEINSLMLTKIEQQRTYNNLLFEQNLLLKKESSVFGEKEIAKAVNYMELYRQKTNEVQSKIKNGALGNINVQSGYINHNYAQDTLKKISNGIASLWGGGSDEGTSRKVYSSIISQYKDLINEYGRLNLSRAESLLTSEFASEEQKRALQDLIDLEKQAQKAGEELDKYLESTFGQLGGDLMNDIVNSLKDGKDAFVEFGKSAGKVLEKLQKQMLFEVHFSERFKKFQEEIKNVYKKGGDSQSVAKEVNTLTSNFVQSMRSNVENATRDFKTFQDELQKNGLYSATSDRKSVEKGFARMSQDSADELNGQFRLQTQLSAEIKNATLQTANFIREMHQSMQTNAAQQLRHLAGIETNTYKLHKMETDLAGVKRGIDELTTKGIKLKS